MNTSKTKNPTFKIHWKRDIYLSTIKDLAKAYLCIPASAACAEGSNSSASFQLEDFREKMHANTLEKLCVITDWMKKPTYDINNMYEYLEKNL